MIKGVRRRLPTEAMTFQQRFRKTAVQVWVNVGVLLCLLLWWHGGSFVPSGDVARDTVNRPRADFMLFYSSAQLIRTSPHQLYDVGRQGEAQKAATGLDISGSDVDFLPFPYPAVVALAVIPFTLFGYRTAYILVGLTNLALLGIAIGVLSARLKLSRAANEVLVLCTTASISVYATLLQGQVSILALLLCVLVITNLRTGNEVRAGAWSGLLAFKLTLLPILLCWFAFRRRWRALCGALAVSGSMAIMSMQAVGMDGSLGYLGLSHRMMRGDFPTALPYDMMTLRALTFFSIFPIIYGS